MKLDGKQFSSGIVGAVIGACSVMGFNALSGQSESTTSSFFAHKAKVPMYEKVETDVNGEVYITPKGKKYHRKGCYILRQSDEVKRASRSDVADVGYGPCKKCRP